MVEVSAESGLSTWAVALNEYLQGQKQVPYTRRTISKIFLIDFVLFATQINWLFQVEMAHVLEKAAHLLSNHSEVGKYANTQCVNI